MDCEERTRMLMKLQEMQFVALELNLYLDTHPCDRDALNDFNCAVEMIKKHKHVYENKYGPILNFGMDGFAKGSWQWVNSPWPWEL